MDLEEGLAPPDQLVACTQLVGQRLVDCLGVALERLLDVAPEHGLGESPGAAVDGHEAAAVLLAGVEQVELRVRHRDLAAAVVEADLANEGDAGALRQARGEPGLVEPGDGQHVAERVAYLRLAGAVHAAAPALGADGHNHAADGPLLADLELADAARGREVVVAERVVAEQVVGGRDPERLVASELVVADPELGVLERCLCGRRGRRLRPRFRQRTDGRWLRGCRRLCWRWCACGRRRSVAGQTCDLGVQPRGPRGRREVAVACRREPPGKLLHVSALPRVPFEEGVEATDDRAIMAAPRALEVEDSRQPLCSEPAPCRRASRRHHLAVVPSSRALPKAGAPARVVLLLYSTTVRIPLYSETEVRFTVTLPRRQTRTQGSSAVSAHDDRLVRDGGLGLPIHTKRCATRGP